MTDRERPKIDVESLFVECVLSLTKNPSDESRIQSRLTTAIRKADEVKAENLNELLSLANRIATAFDRRRAA